MRKTSLVIAIALVAGTWTAVSSTAAGAFEQRFSLRCSASHMAVDDPIVSPGTDASHLHVFFGNVSVQRFSTYASMRASGTTCTVGGDTAGYWIPTLLASDGAVVPASHATAYYRAIGVFRTMSISAFPADLRMISSRHEWLCKDSQTFSSPPNCDTRERGFRDVGLRIVFGSCWDGVNLDAVDHRSHIAFGSTRRGCPSTHPVPMPRLALNVRFDTKNATGMFLSSGEPATAHGDFWNTWDQAELERLVARCLGSTAVVHCGSLT